MSTKDDLVRAGVWPTTAQEIIEAVTGAEGAGNFTSLAVSGTSALGAVTSTGLAVTGTLSSSKTLTLPAGNITANGGIKFGTNASIYADASSLVRVRDAADTGYADVMVGGLATSGNCAVGGVLNLAGASAGQITFPATQNASANANTLDDYEEGTWTPTLINSGSNTYTVQTGTYTKIGRLVTVQGLITVNVATTPGGTLEISGLPFTSSANQKGAASFQISGVNASATTCWMGSVTPSATTIRLYTYAAGALTNPGGYVANGSNFGFSATYEV